MRTKEEVIELVNANPMFHLATVENGKPHVRGMLLFKADERGVIFHTGTFKDLHRQLQTDPSVEMCFFSQKTGEQIRISGELILDKDSALLDEIYNHPSRSFLRAWGAGIEDKLAVYRLPAWKATIWTMDTNFEPKEYIL
jgi:pyridoxamine 5'-phosphate oxidase